MQTSIEKIKTQSFEEILPYTKLIRTIGQGAFAQVFLIYDQRQQIYLAVKKVPLFGLCQYERKLVLNQAKILSSIQHPNIIKFHSCLYDTNQENVYIFMEYAKQGDLLNLIFRTRLQKQQIKQKVIWKIIADIAQALQYLHSNNIIHRDVKPANILQQGDTFKLADMNVSKIKEQGRMTCTNVGTPLYTSPEVARNQFYNQKCDIWSLGVVVYQLCSFKNPFTKASLTKLINQKNKQNKSAIQKIPLNYSRSLSDLVKKMLNKDPKERISVKEILKTCKNQGMQVKNLSSKQKIGQFKTIIFPATSQRWVNLVFDQPRNRDELNLTIDQILKQSEIKNSSYELEDSVLTEKQNQFKYQNPDNIENIVLQQDQYCLSNIKVKNKILKTVDNNIVKVNNFLQKEIKTMSKPIHHIINQRRIIESGKNQKSREKSFSTERHRKFQRESNREKFKKSLSKDKYVNEYGFKFIKLSKHLQNLHS